MVDIDVCLYMEVCKEEIISTMALQTQIIFCPGQLVFNREETKKRDCGWLIAYFIVHTCRATHADYGTEGRMKEEGEELPKILEYLTIITGIISRETWADGGKRLAEPDTSAAATWVWTSSEEITCLLPFWSPVPSHSHSRLLLSSRLLQPTSLSLAFSSYYY